MNFFQQSIARLTQLSFRQRFFLIFVLGLVMCSLPLVLRFSAGDPLFVESSSGYHLRLIHEQQQGFTIQDPLFDRPFLITPYHLLFAFLDFFFALPIAFMILHIILLFFTLYFILAILDFFSVSPTHQLLFSFIFLFSPVTIALYTMVQPTVLSFFLLVFLVWALLQEHHPAIIISCAFLLPFFGFYTALIALFCLLALGKKRHTASLFTLIGTSAVFLGTLFWIYGVPSYFHLTSFESFFADLGKQYSYSIFTLLLALIGVVTTWRMKKKHTYYYALSLLGLLTPFFLAGLLPYQNIFLCIAASFGFVHLYNRGWHLPNLRFLSILLLTCGILFTGLSTQVQLQQEQPQKELMQASFWIDERTHPQSVLATPPAIGSWIAYVSKRSVLVDGQSLFFSDYEQRIQDTHFLTAARTFPQMEVYLQKYGITHIVLTREQQERATSVPALVVLENTENFKKIHENNFLTLWEYQGT